MWMRVSSTCLATTHHPLSLSLSPPWPVATSTSAIIFHCLFFHSYLYVRAYVCTYLHLFLHPTLPLPPLWPTENRLQYNAQSPDEAALVGAAKNFGYIFAVSTICSTVHVGTMLYSHSTLISLHAHTMHSYHTNHTNFTHPDPTPHTSPLPITYHTTHHSPRLTNHTPDPHPTPHPYPSLITPPITLHATPITPQTSLLTLHT